MKNIDFAVARSRHMSWKTRLRSFLDGQESLTEAQAVSHKDCDLGKWMYSEGLKKYGNLREMKDLETIHAQLHSQVKRIVQLKKASDKAGAEIEYKKLEAASHIIIDLLTQIEKNCAA